jgi:hypothetical protein
LIALWETELLKTSNTLSEGFIQYKICLAKDLDSLFEVLKPIELEIVKSLKTLSIQNYH